MSRFNDANMYEMPEDQDVIPELMRCLLTQAFEGRPIKVFKNDLEDEWQKGRPADAVLLVVLHEHKQLNCDFWLHKEDLQLLLNDFAGFRRRIVEPILNNLDGAAFPERWERLLPSIKRTAELMAQYGWGDRGD